MPQPTKREYNVKYRLDGILVEVLGVKADNLTEAIEAGKRICLGQFIQEKKGMKLDVLDGRPRIVGVERKGVWDPDVSFS